MIDISKLKDDDIGRNVIYHREFCNQEVGKLSSWNDKFVFVRFKGPNGEACESQDVSFEFKDQVVENKEYILLDQIVYLFLKRQSKLERVSIKEYIKRGLSAENTSIGKSWINLCRGLSIAGDFTPELISTVASDIADKILPCCLCGDTGEFPKNEVCICQN